MLIGFEALGQLGRGFRRKGTKRKGWSWWPQLELLVGVLMVHQWPKLKGLSGKLMRRLGQPKWLEKWVFD